MKSRFFATLIALCVCCCLFAQQNGLDFGYDFTHYGIEEGLPSNETYYFLEDRQGYLWIGTDKGVARFNGYGFKTYTTKDGLTDNTILRMASGPDGKVWLAGYDNKLCYYDRGRFHPFRYNDKLVEFSRDFIGHPEIDFDEDYRLFYRATRGVLLLSKNGEVELTIKGRIGHNPETHWLIEFNHKTKSYSGMSLDRKGKPRVNIQAGDSTYVHTFLSYKDLSAYFLQLGERKYFYIHGCIIIIEKGKIISQKWFNGETLGMMASIEGDIWVCSMNGVIVMDRAGNIKNRFLQKKQVSFIFQDNNKNIWISTLNEGIYQIKNRSIQTLQRQEAPVQSAFQVLFSLQHKVFGVCKGNEIPCATTIGHAGKVQLFNQSCDFSQAQPSDIFFSSDRYQFNFNHYFISLDSLNTIKSICKNGEHLYAINKATLYNMKKSTRRYPGKEFHYFADNKALNTIYVFDNGDILLGGQDGLHFFIDSAGTAHPRNKLINSRVQDIELLGNDTILATRGNGLKILRKNDILTYTEADGLLNNSVSSLFKFNDQIWIATDGGVNVLSRKGNKFMLEKKITLADGLDSRLVHQLIIVDSTIYMGLERGLAKADMRTLDQHHTTLMPLYFTKVRINDKDTLPLQHYALQHDQRLIRIDFEAIDFRQSGNNILYKYRMRGLSDRWDYTGNPSISYSNLTPASYVFEVAAQYANGDWTVPKRMEFRVYPPYWATWWFRIGAVLLIGGAAYGIYYSSSSARKKREKLAKELNASMQMALGSQINPHFIFNSLNSIYNFLLKNEGESAQIYLVRFSRLIRNVFENSIENYITLNQEVETLKIYLELEQLRFSNKFEYHFQIQEDLLLQTIYVPPMLLQPLIENAIWHGLLSKDDGEAPVLEIRIEKKENILHLSVKDNGVGYSNSRHRQKKQMLRKDKSTGIQITQKRVLLVNQYNNTPYNFTITDFVEDQKIKGTIAAFSLPYLNSRP